jgi:hypothetical protein
MIASAWESAARAAVALVRVASISRVASVGDGEPYRARGEGASARPSDMRDEIQLLQVVLCQFHRIAGGVMDG